MISVLQWSSPSERYGVKSHHSFMVGRAALNQTRWHLSLPSSLWLPFCHLETALVRRDLLSQTTLVILATFHPARYFQINSVMVLTRYLPTDYSQIFVHVVKYLRFDISRPSFIPCSNKMAHCSFSKIYIFTYNLCSAGQHSKRIIFQCLDR